MEQFVGSRYVLRERLGIGGMGVVYRAARRDGSADRAIKLLRSELAEDPMIRHRFIQESNLMRAMRSPNLVAVEDLIVDGDDMAIVMELVLGGTLRDHLEAEGRLASETALAIIRHVLLGLSKVHAVGIVHRDLKPENVLLVGTPGDGDFLAKVSDFGIARLVDGPRMTGTNVFIGTPHYSAPELIEGGIPTTSADIYAVGVVLYELISGGPPFAGTSGYALMSQQLSNPAPRAQTIDDPIWSLLQGWLAIDADRRPRNASEALEELDALTTQGRVPTRNQDGAASAAGLGREPSVPVVVPPPSNPVGSMPGQGGVRVVKQMADASSPDVIDLAALERTHSEPTRAEPPQAWFPFAETEQPHAVVGPPTGWEDTHRQVNSFGGSPWPPEPPAVPAAKRKPPRKLLIAVVAIVVLAVAAVGATFALSGGGGPNSYTLKFAPETYPQSGVTVDRVWTLARGKGKQATLHGELTFHTTKNTDTTINEVLPKSLALSTDGIKFTPQPKIIVSDPEVGYPIRAEAGQTLTATYDITPTSHEVSKAILESYANGQREEAASYYNRANPLKTLMASPNPVKLRVGGPAKHLMLSGTLKNGGKASNVAFFGAVYTVADPRVADVSGTGLVTGLRGGVTVVKIRASGVSGAAFIAVTPATKTDAAGATAQTQSGPTAPKTTCQPGHPGSPTSVHATADSQTTIAVSWNAPASSLPCEPVTGYIVTESGPAGTQTQNADPSDPSVEFTRLSPGKYAYTVVAVANTAKSDPGHSNTVSIVAAECSLAPENVQVALAGQSVSVTWTQPAPTDTCPNIISDLTGYTVNDTGPTPLTNTTDSLAATFDSFASGSYTFDVIANYSGGKQSEAASATPSPIVLVGPCSDPPPAPTGATATVDPASGIGTVTWTNVLPPPNCQVTYSVVGAGMSQVDAVNPAPLDITAPGTYSFDVVAQDSAGSSDADTSNSVSVGCDDLAPSGVTGMTDALSANVAISWTDPIPSAGCPNPTYNVDVDGSPATLTGTTSASFAIADGLAHSVTVTAVYPDGNSLPATNSFTANTACSDGTFAQPPAACPAVTPPDATPVG